MENFEPEKIVRVRWWWDDRSGYYKVNKPGIDLMDAVSASDYDKLLALYRQQRNDALEEAALHIENGSVYSGYTEIAAIYAKWVRDLKTTPQMTLAEKYGTVEIK